MEAFPVLHTPRLQLRKLQVEDVPSLIEYANNKKISDNIINIPHPYQEPDAVFRISYVFQGFRHKTRYVFAIILKEQGTLIGEISLHLGDGRHIAELGYWVGEPFWNKGIATEAIKAVLRFGFDKLDLGRVYATCHAGNAASGKVLLKNGLVQQSVTGSVIQYGITRQVYEEKHRL